jgi:hypothetical protein
MTTPKSVQPSTPDPNAELAEARAAVATLEREKNELIVGHRVALTQLDTENKAALLANAKATVTAKERLQAATLALAQATLGSLIQAGEARLADLGLIHRRQGGNLKTWSSSCAGGFDRAKRERLADMYSRAGAVREELAEAYAVTEKALKNAKAALVSADAFKTERAETELREVLADDAVSSIRAAIAEMTGTYLECRSDDGTTAPPTDTPSDSRPSVVVTMNPEQQQRQAV